MVYQGHVRNGVVVLEGAAAIPEGTLVQVEVVRPADDLQTLREGLRKFAGTVDRLPDDLAANHDRYVHGTARQ